MRFVAWICLVLLGTGIGMEKAEASHGGMAGSISFSFDSVYKANARQRQVKRYYFYRKRCKVVGLYGLTRDMFKRSVRYLNKILKNPHFSALLQHNRRWEMTRDSSTRILAHLLRIQKTVIVNSFRRDRGFPCKTNKADGHVNAFAQRGVKILFLYKPYIEEQQNRGGWGIRSLAKTVLHETMHTLGYSHAGLKVGSKAYNRTVPVFLGCLVKYWPKQVNAKRRRMLRRYCSLSTKTQMSIQKRSLGWLQKIR